MQARLRPIAIRQTVLLRNVALREGGILGGVALTKEREVGRDHCAATVALLFPHRRQRRLALAKLRLKRRDLRVRFGEA